MKTEIPIGQLIDLFRRQQNEIAGLVVQEAPDHLVDAIDKEQSKVFANIENYEFQTLEDRIKAIRFAIEDLRESIELGNPCMRSLSIIERALDDGGLFQVKPSSH